MTYARSRGLPYTPVVPLLRFAGATSMPGSARAAFIWVAVMQASRCACSIVRGSVHLDVNAVTAPLNEQGYRLLLSACQRSGSGSAVVQDDHVPNCNGQAQLYVERVVNASGCAITNRAALPDFVSRHFYTAQSLSQLRRDLQSAWWTLCGYMLVCVRGLHLDALARLWSSTLDGLDAASREHPSLRPLVSLAMILKSNNIVLSRVAFVVAAGVVVVPAFVTWQSLRAARRVFGRFASEEVPSETDIAGQGQDAPTTRTNRQSASSGDGLHVDLEYLELATPR